MKEALPGLTTEEQGHGLAEDSARPMGSVLVVKKKCPICMSLQMGHFYFGMSRDLSVCFFPFEVLIESHHQIGIAIRLKFDNAIGDG